MADTIHLEIVTAAEPSVKASIKQLYIPAYLGKAGVLENHKPYISLLKPGEVCYTDLYDKNHYLYIRDGFMEVKDNKIVILTDGMERGELFNKAEIEAKLSQLEAAIKASTRLAEGMSEEEMKKMPGELAIALEEQIEFETKLKIVQKIEKGKK